MPILSAENNFKKGLQALIDHDYVVAANLFRRAMDVEHQRHVREPDMRYLSYYGLCLAKAHCQYKRAIVACQRAAAGRSRDPKMYLNLGRVYLATRQPRKALEEFHRGLEVDPRCQVLELECRRIERTLGLTRVNSRPGLFSLDRWFPGRKQSASVHRERSRGAVATTH